LQTYRISKKDRQIFKMAEEWIKSEGIL
jgi:hypothetical protein